MKTLIYVRKSKLKVFKRELYADEKSKMIPTLFPYRYPRVQLVVFGDAYEI